MVYIEEVKRKGKTYYHITKNIRLDNKKWKKIRKYVGDKKPSEKEIKKIVDEIEKKALKENLTKTKSNYKYLTNEEAEKIQDLKEIFNKWNKKLSHSEREDYENDFIIKFTYNSNAIEGNRLTLRETSMVLMENIIPAGATPNDYNETINSKRCYNFIKNYTGEFNKTFLLKVHKLITQNTDCKIQGKYRNHEVLIHGSNWIPPAHKKVTKEMEKIFQWYYLARKKLHPVELAGILHNKLVRIHPFSDGNGRTSRFIMNWILMKNTYPMFYVKLKEKIKYYEVVEEGDKGNDSKIIHYIIKSLIEQHTLNKGDLL
jgi:Fic family protein